MRRPRSRGSSAGPAPRTNSTTRPSPARSGIEVGPGRFTKIEPGIGKLLGVLSLQSLPRRITLDFTDVFTEGFAFDEITGDVQIHNGVLMTRQPAAGGAGGEGEHLGRAPTSPGKRSG